jgi:deoxyribonuclease V
MEGCCAPNHVRTGDKTLLLPVWCHSWDLTPREAVALQREMVARLKRDDGGCSATSDTALRTVAGVDVGFKGQVAVAGVVVCSWPELRVQERVRDERAVSFPYVPGLLSFREAPVILGALERLQSTPDMLLVDGQGYAHPRRMGIATHLGVLLERPVIGCAKSRLCGAYEEPAAERGSHTWLRDGEEIIGAVVRTRARVKPVFVSVGYKVSLERAIEIVLGAARGYRLPEPCRLAHQWASEPD